MERIHDHIISTSKCFFTQSNVPKQYWVEAVSIIVYCINRLPSKTTNFASPFSLLFYYKVFGSICFSLILKNMRNRFQPTSIYFCFLGYSISHKAYKCLRLKDSTIVISRHVQFFDDVFPFKDYKTDYKLSCAQKKLFHKGSWYCFSIFCPNGLLTFQFIFSHFDRKYIMSSMSSRHLNQILCFE